MRLLDDRTDVREEVMERRERSTEIERTDKENTFKKKAEMKQGYWRKEKERR